MRVVIRDGLTAPGQGPAGLAWDGHTLWNADFRDGLLYGIDPASGETRRTLRCHGNLSDLTWDGEALWQALYDEEALRKINPVTNDFDGQLALPNQGLLSGVAWDGESLWVVAQQQGQILAVDRDDGTVRRRLTVPVACGGMDYHAGHLWLSCATPMRYDTEGGGFVWLEGEPVYAVLQLDPADGREVARYLCDRLYTGICRQDGTLWLAQTGERRLYRASFAP